MIFELQLLDFLGYRPELTFCISCRDALNEYNLSRFNIDLGGVVCSACHQKSKLRTVKESDELSQSGSSNSDLAGSVHITPLVWKNLVLCSEGHGTGASHKNFQAAQEAAQRLLQGYMEHRAGKRFKSLDLLKQLN
jgi:recombinational DNA repair protein (RecF pathway)